MFHLRTLGGLALEQDGVTLDTVAAQRKTLALITILATSQGRGVSRDRLAAYLWPESDTERARGALKQTVHVARRLLGSPDTILGTADLRLNSGLIQSDVASFLDALDRGALQVAVGLYGGPFLDGFHLPRTPEFEEWASARRDELAHRYAAALERLASEAEDRGDPGAAIAWLRRLLTTDPFSARTTLRLMRALDAAGERIAALRCAQVHEALLREELDSPADPQVAAFATSLREEVARPAPSEEAAPRMPPAAWPPHVAAASPAPTEPAGPEAPTPSRAGRKLRWGRLAVAVSMSAAAVLLAIVITTGERPGEDPAFTPAAASSVAVLPFRITGDDTTSNYLAAGLSEDLYQTLGGVPGLRVAPLTIVLALTRRGLDPAAVADSLDVAAVVEGTFRRIGRHLEVSAQVVRVHDRAILWSADFARELDALPVVQEEIALAALRALAAGSVAGAVDTLPPRRSTVDAEALDLYYRGRSAWKQRSRDGIRQALVFFEAAIDHDPTFAKAYAGLAAAYVNCANSGYCEVRAGYSRADVAAEHALTLDSGLAEGHAVMGFVHASRLEFVASEAAFRRALELDPGLTWAHHYYTLLLLMLGRTDEAVEQNRLALALDPLSLPANATRGIILLQRGDVPGADRELQRALALAPGFHLTLYYLGVARAAQDRHEDAARLLAEAARQAPDFPGVIGARAFVLQRSGAPRTADSLLAAVKAEAGFEDPRRRMNLALAYAVLGRLDAAFSLLEQVQWDVPSLVELRADPLLRPLRSDPRYPLLLRRIGAAP